MGGAGRALVGLSGERGSTLATIAPLSSGDVHAWPAGHVRPPNQPGLPR